MVRGFLNDEANETSDITFISLKEYTTTFWRYQHHANTCLATVEAIYYFYKELEEALASAGVAKPEPKIEKGTWNDLLFLYGMQYYNLKKSNIEKAKAGTISGKHKEYINRILGTDAAEEKETESVQNVKQD